LWINPLFETDALPAVKALIDAQSLATIVVAGPLRASHVPVLLDETEGRLDLVGHMPRVDPVAAVLTAGERALCIFHGARAYVSAAWYGSIGLPTYNFSVAHLGGTASTMTTQELREHLVTLVKTEERRKAPLDEEPWDLDEAHQARIDQLLPAVMGFRIRVDEAQAKAKLGQNRTVEDRASTIAHLASSESPEHRAIAEQMRTVEAPEPRRTGH
jgi:transcriptional regulator